jgi:hypothetical protein
MNQISHVDAPSLQGSPKATLGTKLERAIGPRRGGALRALALCVFCLSLSRTASAQTAARGEQDLAVRGIYVQQQTAQEPKKLRYLIANALKVGLNTFVVDLWGRSPGYAEGIKMIQAAGLNYVPRITIFPDGARPGQVDDQQLLEKRWRLVDYALSLGAKDIQLDYIRFSSKNAPSPQNADKIVNVLRFFRQRIEQRGARMQIDVFGEVSYGPSERIGQDMRRFAPELDAVCPMLYPSHFEPYKETAKTPYQTVHGALVALERQTRGHSLPVYAYIEPFNYRHRMSDDERAVYLEAQLQAVLDSAAQGFYVWSVGNHYDILFNVLDRRATQRQNAGAGKVAAGAAELVNTTVSAFGPPLAPQL